MYLVSVCQNWTWYPLGIFTSTLLESSGKLLNQSVCQWTANKSRGWFLHAEGNRQLTLKSSFTVDFGWHHVTTKFSLCSSGTVQPHIHCWRVLGPGCGGPAVRRMCQWAHPTADLHSQLRGRQTPHWPDSSSRTSLVTAASSEQRSFLIRASSKHHQHEWVQGHIFHPT